MLLTPSSPKKCLSLPFTEAVKDTPFSVGVTRGIRPAGQAGALWASCPWEGQGIPGEDWMIQNSGPPGPSGHGLLSVQVPVLSGPPAG